MQGNWISATEGSEPGLTHARQGTAGEYAFSVSRLDGRSERQGPLAKSLLITLSDGVICRHGVPSGFPSTSLLVLHSNFISASDRTEH